jgi:hypothetical protein
VLCSRQSGKSTACAALALRRALTVPFSLVLLLSRSVRQSSELFRKLKELYRALGRPVPPAGSRDNVLKLELANGSRVISLPGEEETVRCFSGVSLLVIDEAARVPDPLYFAVRPMLATSGGSLVALSTAYAKLGWFYDGWTTGAGWERYRVTADQCPRVTAGFLAEELAVLGPRWFAMEYRCEFQEAQDALFTEQMIAAALDATVKPMFGG